MLPSAHRPEAPTVLVVDDEEDMRLYLRTCLHSLGAVHVIEAADGLEALHLARTLEVHLVISDVLMPGLDGYALCRALKADTRTAAVPLLLVSGETRGPPPCADGFLAKPFNATGLLAQVEPLLARLG